MGEPSIEATSQYPLAGYRRNLFNTAERPHRVSCRDQQTLGHRLSRSPR
jgi:hypothetical protein